MDWRRARRRGRSRCDRTWGTQGSNRARRCSRTSSSSTHVCRCSSSRAAISGSSLANGRLRANFSRSSSQLEARSWQLEASMSESSATPSLERRLGSLDAAAIIIANVIGGGILFTPPQVAAAVPNAFWFLGAWLAGGALALAGAMAYAELAALRPRAGGEYVYLNAAFGRLAAFSTGWTSFVAGFTGAIAASAIVLAFYLGRFVPIAGDSTPFLTIPLPLVPLAVSPQTL